MQWVLLFDTNVERLNLFLSALLGYQVIGVSEFSAAKRLILERQPAIVLADWFDSNTNRLLNELEQIRDRPIPPFYFMADVPNQAKVRECRRRALSQGAFGFIPRPIGQAQFLLYVNGALARARGYQVAEVTTIVLPATFGTKDDPLLIALNGSPYSNIAHLAGGWEVLDSILERHGIRASEEDMSELREAIVGWGSLREEDRLLRAIDLHDGLLFDCRTPVDQVIYDIAHEILYGAGVKGSKAA